MRDAGYDLRIAIEKYCRGNWGMSLRHVIQFGIPRQVDGDIDNPTATETIGNIGMTTTTIYPWTAQYYNDPALQRVFEGVEAIAPPAPTPTMETIREEYDVLRRRTILTNTRTARVRTIADDTPQPVTPDPIRGNPDAVRGRAYQQELARLRNRGGR